MRGRVVVAVLAAAVVLTGVSASAVVDGASKTRRASTTRYSLVNGCYSLLLNGSKPVAPSVGPFRFQAAKLGVYLLYGKHRQYLVDQGGNKIAGADTPSSKAVWRARGTAARGFTLTNSGTHKK